MFEMLKVFIVINPTTIDLLPLLSTRAYIDPNTGGMLFQILAVLFGLFSGMLLFFSGRIKKFYYKIKRRLGKADQTPDQKNQPEESPQEKE